MSDYLTMPPTTRRDHLARQLSRVMFTLTFVGMLGIVGQVSWWLWGPTTTVESYTITLAKPRYEAGTIFEWSITECLSDDRRLPLLVDHEVELLDNLVLFPMGRTSVEFGTRCLTVRRAFPLPGALPAGQYHLHVRTMLQVNPVRDVVQQFTGPLFRVEAAK